MKLCYIFVISCYGKKKQKTKKNRGWRQRNGDVQRESLDTEAEMTDLFLPVFSLEWFKSPVSESKTASLCLT